MPDIKKQTATAPRKPTANTCDLKGYSVRF